MVGEGLLQLQKTFEPINHMNFGKWI